MCVCVCSARKRERVSVNVVRLFSTPLSAAAVVGAQITVASSIGSMDTPITGRLFRANISFLSGCTDRQCRYCHWRYVAVHVVATLLLLPD